MRKHDQMAAKLMPRFETQGPVRRIIFGFRLSGEHKGMMEIILTVCAVANPANCEEKYLLFTFDGSINQCMLGAQPYIAEWIGKHPGWVPTKWSCDYPGHEKRRI
jgi:hypothetical protein